MEWPIYVMTLRRTEYRTVAAMSTLLAHDVPYHSINILYGVDGMDYDEPEQMLNAAAEQYPSMDNLRDENGLPWGRGNIGCFWSYMKALDVFIESDHSHGYFTQDNQCHFGYSDNYYRERQGYPDLCRQVDRLYEIDPNFRLLQCFWKRERLTDYGIKQVEKGLPITHHVQGSSDSALILSKDGAEMLKDACLKTHNKRFPEQVVRKDGIGNAQGVYASMTPERWRRSMDYRIGRLVNSAMPLISDRILLNYDDFKAGKSDISDYDFRYIIGRDK